MREAEQSILQQIELDHSVSAVMDFCRKNEVSMACWRMPNEDSVHIILDFDEITSLSDVSLESINNGFILAPFDYHKSSYFICNQVHILWNEKKVEVHSSDNRKEEEINKVLVNQSIDNHQSIQFTSDTSNDSHEYELLVKNCIDKIKTGHFQKLVPARSKIIKCDFQETHLGNLFKELSENYPSAFVSLTYTSETGIWLGATPELLLSTLGDEFQTVSLAGTQHYNENVSLAEIAWTQKEIEEQALVSRYIINCFKKIRLREFTEHGPKTVRAGNLIHLKTDFKVNMKDTNFPELGSTMLKLLHPTSAVCGMPKNESYDYLVSHEKFDRELFSGYIGPVNFNSSTNLFVNLRCLKLENQFIHLYAGAGVTEDSDPKKEWEETEMKMNTILTFFDSF